MDQTKLLAARKKAKKHQPFFVVKEWHDTARIKKRWRRARGIHSAQRQYHHGKPASPNPGYGSPAAVRGLHPSGAIPILVSNKEQLLALRVEQGAIIAAGVGNKRRLELLRLAAEKKILVLNAKDPQKMLEKISAGFQARQQLRREKNTSKEKKEIEKKKKVQEKAEKAAKKEAAAPLTQKEKKEEEREMLEKTITKSQ